MTPAELNQLNNEIAYYMYRRERRRDFLRNVGSRAVWLIFGATIAAVTMLIEKIIK